MTSGAAPISPRTIAVGLMMGGLVVLGVTSATVISALTDQIHRTAQRQARETDAEPAVDAPVRPGTGVSS